MLHVAAEQFNRRHRTSCGFISGTIKRWRRIRAFRSSILRRAQISTFSNKETCRHNTPAQLVYAVPCHGCIFVSSSSPARYGDSSRASDDASRGDKHSTATKLLPSTLGTFKHSFTCPASFLQALSLVLKAAAEPSRSIVPSLLKTLHLRCTPYPTPRSLLPLSLPSQP